MKTSEVLEHFGSVIKTAAAIGISRTSVYLWGDEPPKQRQYQIEVLTKGRLKASRPTKIGSSKSESRSAP